MNISYITQRYNPQKYWKRRQYVVKKGGLRILKILYLVYIRWCDAFNCASLGTHLGGGAEFEGNPDLVHGLKGIVISHYAKFGKNVRLFQHVTIGNDEKDIKNAPTIGDNVIIYPGAVIIGKITIGRNSKIGANAIVVEDVPEGSLVVGPKSRVIVGKYLRKK
ncbi:MAG: serine acetyltransferase [Candidatus Saccharibacteria bacterium]|nr:serine acetyltransferase [Candidatus Saccharibacteria bacterium]